MKIDMKGKCYEDYLTMGKTRFSYNQLESYELPENLLRGTELEKYGNTINCVPAIISMFAHRIVLAMSSAPKFADELEFSYVDFIKKQSFQGRENFAKVGFAIDEDPEKVYNCFYDDADSLIGNLLTTIPYVFSDRESRVTYYRYLLRLYYVYFVDRCVFWKMCMDIDQALDVIPLSAAILEANGFTLEYIQEFADNVELPLQKFLPMDTLLHTEIPSCLNVLNLSYLLYGQIISKFRNAIAKKYSNNNKNIANLMAIQTQDQEYLKECIHFLVEKASKTDNSYLSALLGNADAFSEKNLIDPEYYFLVNETTGEVPDIIHNTHSAWLSFLLHVYETKNYTEYPENSEIDNVLDTVLACRNDANVSHCVDLQNFFYYGVYDSSKTIDKLTADLELATKGNKENIEKARIMNREINSLQSTLKQKEIEIENLKKKLSDVVPRKDYDLLDKSLATLKEGHLVVKDALKNTENKLATKTKEFSNLSKAYKKLQSKIDNSTQDISDDVIEEILDEEIPITEIIADINKYRTIFVGGRKAFAVRAKELGYTSFEQVHQKGDIQNPQKVKRVFVFADLVGHSEVSNVIAQVGSDVETIIFNGSNIEKALRALHKGSAGSYYRDGN